MKSSSYLKMIFWVFVAAYALDLIMGALQAFGQGQVISGSWHLLLAGLCLGTGGRFVLKSLYTWDFERGRVKREIKLLR